MNGRGLSYGPCPSGAAATNPAIPHHGIFFLLLLCPNPPKAHRKRAQEILKVNLSKEASSPDTKGWTSPEEMAQPGRKPGKSKLDNVIVQQRCVFLSLCLGKLCGTFWLQQSNYWLFARFPLMTQLTESSVSVGGVKV